MCINPSYIWLHRGPKWEQQPVKCRRCWSCKQNRLNDFVGRCLAEAACSQATVALTLTYAPRADMADKVLHPNHFQLFMKLLRRRGHLVRYLVAGEYGDLKGRAHFHALLFFQGIEDDPNLIAPFYNDRHIGNPESSARFSARIPQRELVHIQEWPHGHVLADWAGGESSIRYVCKYLLADDKSRCWLSMSKKPPLGAGWFAQKAARARQLGVMPGGFHYIPPGGDKDRQYLVTGATRRDYLDACGVDPALSPRLNEWVRLVFDLNARLRHRKAWDRLSLEEKKAVWDAELPEPPEELTDAEKAAVAHARGIWLNRLLEDTSDGILHVRGGDLLTSEELQQEEQCHVCKKSPPPRKRRKF